MKTKILIFSAILFAASIAFISCSKDKTEGTSRLNVRLTDAPTAYEEVNVDIREVRVKFSDDTLNNSRL